MRNGLAQMIINVEAQKDEPGSYQILNRAIFYVSRLISSQKERDFVKSNYDGINVPNYQVLFSSKERFLKKFENIINKYDADSRREIYVKHLYNLYSNAPYKEKKRLLNVLKSYGEKKYMVYSKNLRLYIKNSLKKIKIVRVINMIHIKGKKYQILLSNLKSSLEEMKS